MTQIVLPLGSPQATLASVGGKALNLGELIRAGFPVPGGFCVTTAAYAIVSEAAELEPILDALAQVSSADATSLEQFAAAIRSRLMSAPIPESVEVAVTEAYRQLSGEPPGPAVAVRSSATAEDLPFASFAGQQDTYLNM